MMSARNQKKFWKLGRRECDTHAFDVNADAEEMIRVVDESGEDYLFGSMPFLVEIPNGS